MLDAKRITTERNGERAEMLSVTIICKYDLPRKAIHSYVKWFTMDKKE